MAPFTLYPAIQGHLLGSTPTCFSLAGLFSLKNQWFAPTLLDQLCAFISQCFLMSRPHPHPPALNWELVSTSQARYTHLHEAFLLVPLVSSHPHLSPSSCM